MAGQLVSIVGEGEYCRVGDAAGRQGKEPRVQTRCKYSRLML